VRRLAPLVLIVVACVPATTAPTPSATSTAITTTTTTIPVRGGPIPVCATDEPGFALDGNVGTVDGSGSDAASVSAVRWFATEECDRLEIRFHATSGAPALDPPRAAGVVLRDLGVLRLSLGSTVVETAVLDQLVDSVFIKAVFVVRDPNGSLFIDIHLAAAAEARLLAASGPAMVMVDFRSAGDAYPSRPLVTDRVVVIDPTGGAVSAPLTVTGYQRASEVILPTLTAADGSSRQVAASGQAGGVESWVSFAHVFADPPAGEVILTIDQITLPLSVTG
jgi:hypothetical protein